MPGALIKRPGYNDALVLFSATKDARVQQHLHRQRRAQHDRRRYTHRQSRPLEELDGPAAISRSTPVGYRASR